MPEVKIVLGGQMMTRCWETMIEHSALCEYFDYLSLWDGELPMLDIHRKEVLGEDVQFVNVVDVKGKKFKGSVLVGAHGASAEVYAMGMMCPPDKIMEKWAQAQSNPIKPIMVDSGVCQEERGSLECSTWNIPVVTLCIPQGYNVPSARDPPIRNPFPAPVTLTKIMMLPLIGAFPTDPE